MIITAIATIIALAYVIWLEKRYADLRDTCDELEQMLFETCAERDAALYGHPSQS